MLLHRLVQLCWCALALCLWIFVDILRHNLPTNNHASTKTELQLSSDSPPIISEEESNAIANGKKLFKRKCASCHNKNMVNDLTGPALANARKNWAEYPKEDLYSWIRNSQKLAQTNHPRAIKLLKEWDSKVMSSFEKLSDEDIENILDYVDAVSGRQ